MNMPNTSQQKQPNSVTTRKRYNNHSQCQSQYHNHNHHNNLNLQEPHQDLNHQ